jgi:hypothetical protein
MDYTNFRDEIPRRAFIDAEIIQDAQGSGSLNKSINYVSEKYGLADYSLLGPAHSAGLLYCLLVIPREQWWSETVLARVQAHDPFAFFSFDSKPDTTEQLFRRLRNAVAHADFAISSDGTFTFWDRRRRDEAPNFAATISLQQLQRFLSVIGAELANSFSAG